MYKVHAQVQRSSELNFVILSKKSGKSSIPQNHCICIFTKSDLNKSFKSLFELTAQNGIQFMQLINEIKSSFSYDL